MRKPWTARRSQRSLTHSEPLFLGPNLTASGTIPRPVRIEKDVRGNDGKPDIFEYYEATDPSRMVIVRKEEDLDGDGTIDQVAYYERGKLSRKEILNKAPAKKK